MVELSRRIPRKGKTMWRFSQILCGASRLKCDDPRLKSASRVERMCEACDEYAIEDVKHVIMHCPLLNHIRNEMHNRINSLPNNMGQIILNNPDDMLYTLLGKRCRELDDETFNSFIMITSECNMYRTIVRNRQGIGWFIHTSHIDWITMVTDSFNIRTK